MNKKFFVLGILCYALIAPGLFAQQPLSATIERGHFVLHKFEQPIGEENYEITRTQNGVSVKIDFKFTDRGTTVPLTASFRGAPDLKPQEFVIKGKNSRQSDIDQAVEVESGKVRLRDRDKWTDESAPSQFFTIAGYAPTTMQMLMVDYWMTHGSPKSLTTLPSGAAKIEPRGEDSISVNGKSEKLSRYTVEGLIWGRETLWFNGGNLVAAITTDAEFDHFEAIRDGYEGALGNFIARAGADNMAALAELSKSISGSHAETLALVGATLIDGTGAAPIANSAIVIEKGRIIAVGPRSQVNIPANASVIDETGKTILPGLWDMHAHFEQVEWGPIYLAAGVTTVRDCGNEFEFIKATRDAIADGRGLGPRLLLAGIVDGTGKYTVGVNRVDTPEEAKAWVDRYHNAGFQQMKIYSSVKLEEVKVITEEAHRLGMTVTGHIPEGLHAFQTIEAGQDQINHVQYIADILRAPLPPGASRLDNAKANGEINLNSTAAQDTLAYLKAHHIVVDPTLALMEYLTSSTAKPPASFEPGVLKLPVELAQPLNDVGPPSPEADVYEKQFEKYVEIVGALHKAGVPIVAGTDQTVPGYSLHREIELYKPDSLPWKPSRPRLLSRRARWAWTRNSAPSKPASVET